MIWLTWLILGVGVAECVAAAFPRRPVAALVSGIVAVGALGGFATVADWLATAFVAGAVVVWRWLSVNGERDAWHARGALLGLVIPAAVLVGFSGFAGPVSAPLASWLTWMDLPGPDQPPERLLLLFALAVANTSAGNRIVRLVLIASHARPPRLPGRTAEASSADAVAPASERLRGGRLLGPLERLIILGFGAAGYLEASGLIIAAKGLLRFPELQAAAKSGSAEADEVTEYFLVGTLTSLLLALASAVLLM
ncbi:MAG: hypothetical protein QM708_04920 [Propioniciclava sp.]|uniref:hypothetical protein n=1 Tax=Propioniciclava sp. TaxID=2038686 RepID=UPI0039E41AD3